MPHRRSIALTLAAAVCVSGAVSAGERMMDEQIRQLISDHTTYGKSETKKGRHSHSFWRADGTVVGWNSEEGARKGTWRVTSNMICRQDEGDKERCNEVYDNGDGTYGRYVQPKNLAFPRKHVATWIKVVPGNAENLE